MDFCYPGVERTWANRALFLFLVVVLSLLLWALGWRGEEFLERMPDVYDSEG